MILSIFNPKKGGLQKSLKRVGGGNIAHRLYMVFRTIELLSLTLKLSRSYSEKSNLYSQLKTMR